VEVRATYTKEHTVSAKNKNRYSDLPSPYFACNFNGIALG
jgi:hypothetical protein